MNAERRNWRWAARIRLLALAWFCWASSFSLATPVPSCPAGCECVADGGGLRRASCADVRWNGVAYADVRVLALQPSRAGVECRLPATPLSKLFPRLESVSLRNCSLASLPSDAFRRLTSLREVDLSSNSLGRLSPSLFADQPKLRYLNAENNPLGSRPLPRSDALWEVNLARCDLGSRLAAATLAGLPNLRYLSLADNGLRTFAEHSLPSGLKRLDLSANRLVDVPLSELHRLKGLKEVDLSRNPVNCTCQLMGFQNWLSGQGTVFRNQIRCASPAQYAGHSLVDVPQRRLCDVDDRWPVSEPTQPDGERAASERFDQDDDFLFDVQIGRVVGEEGAGHRHSRRSATLRSDGGTEVEGSGGGAEEEGVEGSGSGSTEDAAVTSASSRPWNESSATSAGPSPTSAAQSSSQSTTADESSGESMARHASESTTAASPVTLPDAGATPPKKPQPTESTDADDVHRDTIGSPDAAVGNSTSGDGRSTSAAEGENGAGDSTTSTASAAAASHEVEGGRVTFADAPDSATKVEDLAATPPPENETEAAATLGRASQKEREQRHQRPESRPVELGALAGDGSASATRPAKEEGGSAGRPTQGQMTKDERVEAASATAYVVPSLLIVAVALVCVAVYLGQHNCRPNRWNRDDAKANGPSTEMQDVGLLRAETRPSDPYSNKYEAEGRNARTEKLTNGDRDRPLEESALLADRRPPPVIKSTTRVTTNYESLPKTPIVIQKS